MTEIAFTKVKLPFGWLGNMSPFPITHGGKDWFTTEALFQALRFDDEEIIEGIRAIKSPMTAKMAAKKHKEAMIVEPLSDQDVENMKLCVRLKLEQHPDLVPQLLETGDALIVEDCTSRGRRGSNLFWGAVKTENGWEGENKLGNIWMEIRNELRQNEASGGSEV